VNWPDSDSIPIVGDKYHTPEGAFARVTKVAKLADTSPERLIQWNVEQERVACFGAAEYALETYELKSDFRGIMEERLGSERAGLKAMRKAGDFGTAVHQEIRDRLRSRITGQAMLPVPMTADVERTVDLFESWHVGAGLRPICSEQKVWSTELGLAGTIDYLAECPQRGLGIVDFKTSNYVMTGHHVQVQAYKILASRWADIKWACILHLPNKAGKTLRAIDLGQLYDRRLTDRQLTECFTACLTLHKLLVSDTFRPAVQTA
jgi:hypothetical protein